ncbi:MAG TPA: dihydrofolate reductase family protein [Candidatus Bathyarchaeia archaeon]|nr:dihydrofolate reductase family protein [Candidatus Bathyarchaeia archaeon]HLP49005.1 dihydrofolate reductase family protein [Candidatus Kapabacteria bacterium]
MKVILFMAMSVNGYIARENGDEDFLSNKNWETFCSLAKKYGCFVIGRKTYEAVQKWDEGYNFDSIEAVDKVIITKNKDFQVGNKYIIANSPADAVGKLKGKGYDKILLTGGATINSAFMKERLIDEVILNVEPFLLGNGIPVFSNEDFENKLKLQSSEKLDDGIIQLRYKIC